MKMFDMSTMGIILVDLEYDSLHMSTRFSISMGESPVVDRMYRSSYILLIG